MAYKKFLQPHSAIEVVGRSKGPRTLLTSEAIQAGGLRVANGEDRAQVALELAIEEVALVEAIAKRSTRRE